MVVSSNCCFPDMMDSNLCSYYGVHDLTITNKDYTLSEPYGGETIIQVHVLECNTCGFTADDSDYNDPLILEGLAVIERQSMMNGITELNSLGFYEDNSDLPLDPRCCRPKI